MDDMQVKFDDISINKRILIGFLPVFLCMASYVVYTLVQLGRLNALLDDVAKQSGLFTGDFYQASKLEFQSLIINTAMSIFLVLIFIAFVAFYLARSISRSLQEALDQVALQRAGDGRIKDEVAGIACKLQESWTFDEFGDTVTNGLAQSMDMIYCAFYLADTESACLRRCGGYACDGAVLAREFAFGQGLIGQAAKEKRTILLPLTAKDRIGTNIGGGRLFAGAIMFAPIVHQGRVLAVLELALEHLPDDEKTSLLNGLLPVVAMNLEILTRKLETQQLQEELLAQRQELEDSKDFLTHSEEWSRLILGSVTEGIWGLDNSGNTIFINPAGAAMVGYTQEEIVGFSMHNLVQHSCADGSNYPSEQCQMYRTSVDGVARTISDEALWRKDGTIFPVEYTTTPIYKEGELTGTVIVVRDISGRMKAERRLKFNRHVVENAGPMFWINLENGLVEYANKAACRHIGYELEELFAGVAERQHV